MIARGTVVAALVGAMTLAGAPAHAHQQAATGPVPAILREVGFDQHPGALLPLDLAFTDDASRPLRLRDLVGRRPLIVVLVQYECRDLCPLVLEGLAAGLRDTRLGAGADYDVAVVSLDARETPRIAHARKYAIVGGYFRDEALAAWHFLTGSAPAIRTLAAAIGERYAFDATTNQFAHPTGVVVVTPEGRVARYLFGMDFPARDLRLAIVESSGGRIGTVVDHVLLACYRYDNLTGRYTPLVMRILRAAGAATVAGLGLFLFVMFRAERRRGGRGRPA